MKKIIAFIGRAGSGKDYQCSLLQKKGFQRIAFADALRDITAKVLGYDYDEFIANYDTLKSAQIYNNQTGRNIMEALGSGIRKYDPSFWIKAVVNELYRFDKVCISDLRYANEYYAIYEYAKQHNINFHCIFCDFRSERYQEKNNHESARLSNSLVKLNYKDLDELSISDIILADRQLSLFEE